MKEYVLSHKNKPIVKGNLTKILSQVFKIADQIGCTNPTIEEIDNITEIVFEGYYCYFKLYIEEIGE